MKAIFLSFCLATGAAIGSGEIGVALDRLSIGSFKHKLEVTVTKVPESAVALAITFEGEKFEIPKGVMAQFLEIQLRSVRVLTHVPTGHLPDGWLSNHPYIISFDYGDAEVHGRDGHEVEVYARARLHCHKASYSGWEKIIPEGDFKNRWKLFQPMLLEGDGFNGTEVGIECPLDN